MKVFVLCVDGLDYDFVEIWRLKGLIQDSYGYFKIKNEYFHRGVPYTPLIWTSIITAKKPSEHNVYSWWSYGKILDWIRYKPPFKWIKNKRYFLMKLGFKPRVVTRKDWNRNLTTIFDVVKPSIPLFIPAYNEPSEPHIQLEKALSIGIHRYINQVLSLHEWRERILFEKIRGNWRLFMVWFDILDLLGHIYYIKNRHILKRSYERINELSERIRFILDSQNEKYVLLVISDHGMTLSDDGVTGNHSDYAFYSVNADWKPSDFTDYYPQILRWVNSDY
jgi:predicted AlkP superfamily pyrophosphatase or phosphodiesterase